MEQQTVVVTGAGSGLGAALVRKYSEKGAHVCLIGRTEDKLQTVAASLVGSWDCFEADISQAAQIRNVIQSILDRRGRIDVLINSAGVIALGAAQELMESSVHEMIDTNLKGTIFTSQAVLPHFKERNQGILVNIISTAGQEGKAGESVYCASKFGVRGFTESLQVELKDTDIRVMAAYMGGMNTEFWDGIFPAEKTARLMDPRDIADLLINNIESRPNLSVTSVTIKNHMGKK